MLSIMIENVFPLSTQYVNVGKMRFLNMSITAVCLLILSSSSVVFEFIQVSVFVRKVSENKILSNKIRCCRKNWERWIVLSIVNSLRQYRRQKKQLWCQHSHLAKIQFGCLQSIQTFLNLNHTFSSLHHYLLLQYVIFGDFLRFDAQFVHHKIQFVFVIFTFLLLSEARRGKISPAMDPLGPLRRGNEVIMSKYLVFH